MSKLVQWEDEFSETTGSRRLRCSVKGKRTEKVVCNPGPRYSAWVYVGGGRGEGKEREGSTRVNRDSFRERERERGRRGRGRERRKGR